MSRRDFQKAAAAIGVGMLTMPVTRRAMAANEKPMYFGWAGYDDASFIPSYIEKHGDAPDYTFWGSEDEAFQKMRAGGFVPDVMAPCTYELRK